MRCGQLYGEISSPIFDYFHAMGMSFHAVKHSKCTELFNAMQPAFKLPSRKKLERSLLDSFYERAIQFNKSKVGGGQVGTIMIDRWKNTAANFKIVFTTLNVGGKNHFLKAVDVTGQSETGDLLQSVVENACVYAKDTYCLFNVEPLPEGHDYAGGLHVRLVNH